MSEKAKEWNVTLKEKRNNILREVEGDEKKFKEWEKDQGLGGDV